jgi:hypothetical protein
VKPPRRLLGYKRSEIDQLLHDVAESFEEVWRERGELADKLEDAEKRLDDVAQREALLASTLVAAERTAVEHIDAARRQAEIILAEAHQESRSITRTAQGERERLFAEARRIETLLRSALGMVEESRHEPSVAPGETPAPLDPWPNREDTREFQPIVPRTSPAPEPEPAVSVDEREPLPDPEPAHEQEPPAPELQRDLEPGDRPAVQDAADPDYEDPWTGRDFVWGG